MNWSGAKNILIIVFIFINLVLLFINASIISADTLTSETIGNTVLALSERNVQLKCLIPDEIPKMAILKNISSSEKSLNTGINAEKFFLESEITNKNVELIDEKRSVMAPHHVLLKNFTFTASKQSIVSITEGYLQRIIKTKNNEEQFIPVWCIITDGGNVKYYKAFTGEEITG